MSTLISSSIRLVETAKRAHVTAYPPAILGKVGSIQPRMRAEGDHYGHFLNEGPLYTGIYKMKELASILAAITAALLAGTAIAAPKPSPGTQVVDSRGTVVGTIVGADPTNDLVELCAAVYRPIAARNRLSPSTPIVRPVRRLIGFIIA
jgi:hypothetical protein